MRGADILVSNAGMTREQVIRNVILERQSSKPVPLPEEVGALALFLCRDVAQNTTGANCEIDGGWTAQ